MTASVPSCRADGASLLLRVSVESDSSDSLARQEHDLRTLATALGLEVRHVHADVGISGASTNRPGLAAWLDDARQFRVGTRALDSSADAAVKRALLRLVVRRVTAYPDKPAEFDWI